jgi:hypothetical protein
LKSGCKGKIILDLIDRDLELKSGCIVNVVQVLSVRELELKSRFKGNSGLKVIGIECSKLTYNLRKYEEYFVLRS